MYERLHEVMPHPLVALNHTVAIAMATGPDAGLARVDAVGASPALQGYHILRATRADLLRRLGRNADAAAPIATHSAAILVTPNAAT